MTIEKRYRLITVFMFLFAFKAGFHIAHLIFQGPIWSGILVGLLFGLFFAWFQQFVLRITDVNNFIPIAEPKPPEITDPIQKEFLVKLDVELTEILKKGE